MGPSRDFHEAFINFSRARVILRRVLIERSLFKALLAGDEEVLVQQATNPDMRWLVACVLAVVVSCGTYGATFGLWLSMVQGVYTGIKLPAVILLTCAGNAGLNGCLALVLGTGIGFRQSTVAILMSFTIMGLVLVSFAPLMLFLICESSRAWRGGSSVWAKDRIARACVGDCFCRGGRKLPALANASPHHRRNKEGLSRALFVARGEPPSSAARSHGSLRPRVATSGGGVSFFSSEPMRGNFFEAVWHALRYVLFNQ